MILTELVLKRIGQYRPVTPRECATDGEVGRAVTPVRSRSGSSNLSTPTHARVAQGIEHRLPEPGCRRFESFRGRLGRVPEWLGSGLQNRVRRFDPGHGLDCHPLRIASGMPFR